MVAIMKLKVLFQFLDETNGLTDSQALEITQVPDELGKCCSTLRSWKHLAAIHKLNVLLQFLDESDEFNDSQVASKASEIIGKPNELGKCWIKLTW